MRYFQFYRDNADLLRVQIEAAQTRPAVEDRWHEQRLAFYQRIARSLRKGKERGLVRPSVQPDVAAALLGGMTEFYAYVWFGLGRHPDLPIEQVSAQLSAIWAVGVFTSEAADPGLAAMHRTLPAVIPPKN
jgi:hypothetical protein